MSRAGTIPATTKEAIKVETEAAKKQFIAIIRKFVMDYEEADSRL